MRAVALNSKAGLALARPNTALAACCKSAAACSWAMGSGAECAVAPSSPPGVPSPPIFASSSSPPCTIEDSVSLLHNGSPSSANCKATAHGCWTSRCPYRPTQRRHCRAAPKARSHRPPSLPERPLSLAHALFEYALSWMNLRARTSEARKVRRPCHLHRPASLADASTSPAP